MNNSTIGDSGRFYLNDEDCDSIYQIPSGLLESYGVNSPSKVWLKVDDSGKRWKVKIEKFKGCYFLTDGWKEFAEQVDLRSLAWLKFKPGILPKQTGISKEKTRKRSGDVNVTTSSIPNENKDKCSGVGTQLSFTKNITKDYYLAKLYIPSQFVLNMGMQIPGEIKLKDSEGRVWPICLKQTARVPTLASGWSDFVKDNDVMVGSKVSFTWLSGNMLQARIVKEGELHDNVEGNGAVKEGELLDNVEGNGAVKEGEFQDNVEGNGAAKGELQDNVKGNGAEKIWRFCKKMKYHHEYNLEIPLRFTRAIGLRKEEGLKLKNGEGREWPVGLSQRITKGRSRTFIMSGWAGFVIDNKVMLGSKVTFTWLSGNTLQTEISEVGTDKQQLRRTAPYQRKCL